MILYRIRYLILFICSVQGEMCEEAGRANSSIQVDYNLRGEAGQAYSLEIFVGTPQQKLNVIVDTGSTTLAIAAYPREHSSTYFRTKKSCSYKESQQQLFARYSQGFWTGRLAEDVVFIPSLSNEPIVCTKFAIIENSCDFFMNGSDWQGLMGLAYYPIGTGIEETMVRPWLDFLEDQEQKPLSFELNLCGADINLNNATHYGSFIVSGYKNRLIKQNAYQTPILRKIWYQVGVLGIHIVRPNYDSCGKDGPVLSCPIEYPDPKQCAALNAEKSIIDSGTTNIRLPVAVYEEVVEKMRKESNLVREDIPDKFWTKGKAACFDKRQNWSSLPWIGIDLLHTKNDNSFFTVMLPPENYMRVIKAYVSNDTVAASQFCYKLGVEAGGTNTVLGYTAMEGLSMFFNRSAGWISIKSGNCGPNAHVIGPFTTDFCIRSTCNLFYIPETPILTKLALWILLVMSIIVFIVVVHVFSPMFAYNSWLKKMATRDALAQDRLAHQELI